MEELQTTEILEKEILDDARKKALRILKSADEAVSAKNAEWEKKLQNSIAELDSQLEEKIEYAKEKIMARLPVDKIRLKAQKIENSLMAASDDWYKSLDSGKRTELLTNELAWRLRECAKNKIGDFKKASFSGMEKAQAQIILKNSGLNLEIEEAVTHEHFPCLIIENEETRIIVSVQMLLDNFLAEKREELAEALVGRKFLESTCESSDSGDKINFQAETGNTPDRREA